MLRNKSINDKLKTILFPVKEDINVCTDLIIDIAEIKNGRKVTDIIFYIHSKAKIPDNYKNLRKDKLILEIQREIHNLTGFIFEARHMNNLHRTILQDLLKILKSKNFKNILIRSPENFFIYKLKEIQESYNLELLNKKIEDY